MRIGIDARLYGERGLGRYIAELLLHLEEVDTVNEYIIVMRTPSPPARGGVGGGGSGVVYKPKDSRRFQVVYARSRWYSIAEQWEIPRIFSREKCDLVHIPHMNVPLLLKLPFVVTIHDLILKDFPSPRGSRLPRMFFQLKYALYQRVFSRAVRRAAHIFAPSQYVKDRLCLEYGRNGCNVTVTPEGSSLPVCDAETSPYSQPYFLVVGSAYPHKNLEAVIDAFRELQRTGLCNNTETRSLLLIVGKDDYFMRRLKREKGIERGELYMGEVSDKKLSCAYRYATALVFASCEEGFGLPGIEALQEGIPVIASDRSSLPEVYGDRALYVNPYDKEDIRRVMDEVLRLPVDVIKKSIRQQGGWRTLAERTLDVYMNR